MLAGITMHWGSAAVNAPDHLMAQVHGNTCTSTDAQAQQAAHQQGRSELLQWLQLGQRSSSRADIWL